MLKAVFPVMNEAKAALEKVVDYLNSDSYIKTIKIKHAEMRSKIMETRLNKMFKENKETFKEIIMEVWDDHQDGLKWMDEWIEKCLENFNETTFEEYFVIVSRIIFEHIGLPTGKPTTISAKLLLNVIRQF